MQFQLPQYPMRIENNNKQYDYSYHHVARLIAFLKET